MITPHARVHDVPWIGQAVERIEWALMRGAASQLGGFVIYTMERR